MLANDEMVFFPFLFGFIIFITWLSQRFKLRLERLKTIQGALQAERLDEDTRRRVLEALSSAERQRGAWMQALGGHMAMLARNLLFVGGWISMFVGGAFWILNSTYDDDRFTRQGGMIATFVGFALVTLPMALREMDSRRAGNQA